MTRLLRETVAGRQNVLQLLGWADDDRVIALGCAGRCENEFRSRLVLVTVDGRMETYLTGDQDTRDDGSWHPVFTLR